jgi:hypothetical protein
LAERKTNGRDKKENARDQTYRQKMKSPMQRQERSDKDKYTTPRAMIKKDKRQITLKQVRKYNGGC